MEAQCAAPARKRRLRLTWRDILGWRFSLLDDAGIQHQLDMRAMRLGWSRRNRHRERLRTPRTELLPSAESLAAKFVAVMTILIVLNLAIPAVGRSGSTDMAILFIALSVGSLLGSTFVGASFRHRRPRYVGLMKLRALCPACISSLEGLPVPPDGLVPCPECGAKWHFGSAPPEPPVCTACRYPLLGIPPDPTGALTCPECGTSVAPAPPHPPLPVRSPS